MILESFDALILILSRQNSGKVLKALYVVVELYLSKNFQIKVKLKSFLEKF